MSKLAKCIHGGGQSCVKHGGTGDSYHAHGYIHKYPIPEELSMPVSDYIEPVAKSEEFYTLHQLSGLTQFFDEDMSRNALNIRIDPVISSEQIVKKSLYDFDLDSKDGVVKLLELLPVMDGEILKEIAGEIWPGYPVQDSNVPLLRMEVKGYLMDYLDEENKHD